MASISECSENATPNYGVWQLLDEYVAKQVQAVRPLPEVEREFRRAFLIYAIRASGGSVMAAARALKMHRNSLHRAMRELHILRTDVGRYRPQTK